MRWEDHGRREGWLDAWKALNQRVADDLAQGRGRIRPAKILHRLPHPLKVLIGGFQARLLRGRFRKGVLH